MNTNGIYSRELDTLLRFNQTLEDMLNACVLNFKSLWQDHMPILEFS